MIINGSLQPHHPILPSVRLPEGLWGNRSTPARVLDPDKFAVMEKTRSSRQRTEQSAKSFFLFPHIFRLLCRSLCRSRRFNTSRLAPQRCSDISSCSFFVHFNFISRYKKLLLPGRTDSGVNVSANEERSNSLESFLKPFHAAV